MQISIGNDHRGVMIKAKLQNTLEQLGHHVFDDGASEGESSDYPDIAKIVAQRVSLGEADRGILICGTGIGMAIAANKIPGIRAITCGDLATAEICRRHNDVNVLCLAQDFVEHGEFQPVLKKWLETEFEGGRHERRVNKITALENNANP
ncbi:ribose 5-phosphate isomerase B [Mariniblastus sp.]|jgi:ribose 5-phosphate isomerase B|nr:ribose 5-phosphate isomerase B [Mariniblastus sp.]MDB4757106.1 ribose 5-phosphate isomerase B [Mariniblastus sp.]